MNILYLLIPLGLVLLGIAVWAFMWAVRSGQFDDLEGPAHRILMDDDEQPRRDIAPDNQSESDSENGGSRETHSEQSPSESDHPLQDKGK